MNMNRRNFLKSATAVSSLSAGVGNSQSFSTKESSMSARPIPSSGELLPVIGLGTWQTFDVGADSQARARLKEVLSALIDGGGSVVDSSPMYGSSEDVVGALSSELNVDKHLFKASKVWTRGKDQGIAEMKRSMQRMNAPVMDLMQVHNLLDADVHIDTLSQWKDEGLVRYLGITHYHSGGYSEMKRLMQKHQLDFIQINYSILDRGAEKELLPMAREMGIAVLINRPFETGSLFRKVRGKSLPDWSQEFDCNSWGQFFLKYILAEPAVTCLIPGTSKLKHMVDNLGAGRGALPTKAQRKAMLSYLSNLA
jgi:diketogulonate reductase-like aldo/keto reductase